MMKYKVQGMTSKNYDSMMCGSHYYRVREFWIEANTKEEAYNIATKEHADLVINDYMLKVKKKLNNKKKNIKKNRRRKKKRKGKRRKKSQSIRISYRRIQRI